MKLVLPRFLFLLIVSGCLAQAEPVSHRCLVGGCGAGAITLLAKDGSIEWRYPLPTECSDAWQLPNGNLFFSFKAGVREVRKDQSTVWEFLCPEGSEIQGCQPLGENNFLVGESRNDGFSLLYEMDRGRKITKTIPLKLGGNSHQQLRQVRKTPQGTYLLGQQRGGGKAMEFNANGELLRTFPSGRFANERLPNGNTLISCGDEHRVIEVDPQDRIIWEVKESDVTGNKIGFAAGVVRLANGNTIICNWGGHGGTNAEQATVFEITKDKQVVWELRHPKIQRISTIRVLDQETLTP